MSTITISGITINEDYINCRIYGHHWDSIEIEFLPRHYIETMACDHCGARRHDHINRTTGTIEHRRYAYPTGYRTLPGKTIGADERGHLRAHKARAIARAAKLPRSATGTVTIGTTPTGTTRT